MMTFVVPKVLFFFFSFLPPLFFKQNNQLHMLLELGIAIKLAMEHPWAACWVLPSEGLERFCSEVELTKLV